MFIPRALIEKKQYPFWTWLALTGILLVGAFLRFYQLEYKSLWVDEIIQIQIASGSFLDTISNMRSQPAAPPLDYLITWLTLQTGKNGNVTAEFVLRFPDVVWGILAIAFGYLLAKRATGSVLAALLAAYLIALAPLLVRFSQEVRFYSLSVLTTVALAYFFLRAYQRSNLKHWLVVGAALLIAFFTHYYALLVLGALLVYVGTAFVVRLWRARDRLTASIGRRRLFVAGAVVLVLIGIVSAWLLYAAPRTTRTQYFKNPSLLEVVGEPITSGHVGTAEHLLAVRILGMAVLPALALLGVVWSRTRQSRQPLVLAIALIFVMGYAGILGLDWLFGYFFTSRQLLITVPFYAILIALGIVGGAQFLWQKNRVVGALAFVGIVAGITLVFALSLRAYYDWPKDDIRSAARLLQHVTAVKPAVLVSDPVSLRNYMVYYEPALGQMPGLPKPDLTVRNLDPYERVWFLEQDGRRPPIFTELAKGGWNVIDLNASPALHLHYAGRVPENRLWQEVARVDVPAQILIYSDLLEQNKVCDTDNVPLVVNARAALTPPTDPPLLDAQRSLLRRKLRRLC